MSDGREVRDEQEIRKSGWRVKTGLRRPPLLLGEVRLLPLSPISFSEERRDVLKRGA